MILHSWAHEMNSAKFCLNGTIGIQKYMDKRRIDRRTYISKIDSESDSMKIARKTLRRYKKNSREISTEQKNFSEGFLNDFYRLENNSGGILYSDNLKVFYRMDELLEDTVPSSFQKKIHFRRFSTEWKTVQNLSYFRCLFKFTESRHVGHRWSEEGQINVGLWNFEPKGYVKILNTLPFQILSNVI